MVYCGSEPHSTSSNSFTWYPYEIHLVGKLQGPVPVLSLSQLRHFHQSSLSQRQMGIPLLIALNNIDMQEILMKEDWQNTGHHAGLHFI